MRQAIRRALPAALLALVLAGCASSDEDGGSIMVFAASSLQESFETIAAQFEAANPGTDVALSFAGSSGLAAQLTSGAAADVFASASPATMRTVVAAGAAADPVLFATNTMQIAVPPGNPGGVTGLADLADPEATVAICQPQVPCGAAAQEVLANAALSVAPDTLEPDARAVLTRVILGEVDAGIVYVTDVRSAGARVVGIDIPADVNATTDYPIATLASAADPGTASAFVAYVLSPDGQAVLSAAGFGRP